MNFEDIFENDKGIFIQHYNEFKDLKSGKASISQLLYKQNKIPDKENQ